MEQMKLEMTYFPYCEYLGGFQRMRRAEKRNTDWQPWKQLELQFVLRRLQRGGVSITLNLRNKRIFHVNIPNVFDNAKRIATTLLATLRQAVFL